MQKEYNDELDMLNKTLQEREDELSKGINNHRKEQWSDIPNQKGTRLETKKQIELDPRTQEEDRRHVSIICQDAEGHPGEDAVENSSGWMGQRQRPKHD